MATTVLYPNSQQTFSTVVSAVLAGNTMIMWVLNNRVALGYNPSITTSQGQKVFVANPANASTFNGLVVMYGNTGLAAAVNGSYGFTWNGQTTQNGQHSDDLAQAAVYDPRSPVLTAPSYGF